MNMQQDDSTWADSWYDGGEEKGEKEVRHWAEWERERTEEGKIKILYFNSIGGILTAKWFTHE